MGGGQVLLALLHLQIYFSATNWPQGQTCTARKLWTLEVSIYCDYIVPLFFELLYGLQICFLQVYGCFHPQLLFYFKQKFLVVFLVPFITCRTKSAVSQWTAVDSCVSIALRPLTIYYQKSINSPQWVVYNQDALHYSWRLPPDHHWYLSHLL